MAVNAADFLTRFPEFDSIPVPVVQTHLDDADAVFSETAFVNPARRTRAVMLLAAHYMTLSGLGQTAEATIAARGFSLEGISSVSDGGVSISMRESQTSGLYPGTRFGRELSQLIRVAVTRAVVGAPEWLRK